MWKKKMFKLVMPVNQTIKFKTPIAFWLSLICGTWDSHKVSQMNDEPNGLLGNKFVSWARGGDLGFKVCYHACTKISVKRVLFSLKLCGTVCTQNRGKIPTKWVIFWNNVNKKQYLWRNFKFTQNYCCRDHQVAIYIFCHVLSTLNKFCLFIIAKKFN